MGDALFVHGGVTDAQEARLALAGLIAVHGATLLDARTGVMHGAGSTALVTGTTATAPMTVSIAPHQWVTSRGNANGPYVGSLAAAQTVTIGAAPGSGTRVDVVYVKQNDPTPGVPTPDTSPATAQPIYGVLAGTVGAGKPSLASIVGAEELATVSVSAGATKTTDGTVLITNTARQVVARGAEIPVRNTTERDALSTYTGLHVKRLDLGGVLERWVTGTTWARYDALQIPVRNRRVAATASGTLGDGASVPIAAAQTLPAAPHGAGVPYRVTVKGSYQVSLPAGLGAVLTAQVGGTSYELDRETNGGSSSTFTLSGSDDFNVTTDTAQTVTVTLTALAGTITGVATGKVAIETAPNTAL